MRKQVIFICIVLLLMNLGISRTEGQPPQNFQPLEHGMLLEPLNSGILSQTLCVINTENKGAQWFILGPEGGYSNIYLGTIEAALHLITDVKVSPDGEYAAVLSVGEGHPIIEVIDLPRLLEKKVYKAIHTLDPYPGVVGIHGWDGIQLQIESTMLLTRRDNKSGRVPAEFMLFWPETFALNVVTGDISGVSEGARQPVKHYSRVLVDRTISDAEKDEAFATLLKLNPGAEDIPELLKVLEQETNPERMNTLLDQINKLRQ